jgi:serine/threonine-protein kinase
MTPQHSIGHYRIVSKLGEGGMGAVYRATDTRLNRDVAIKVLPDSFANDPNRLARFTREAQILASLDHPNIAGIYGIEESALIMELVEGEDLKGPLPLDTALDYARQIAAGLEAAHEKGIIHRDLKPANIRITPDARVKILDFGLAKAADSTNSAATAASPTMSPTLALSMTQAGVLLGTAAYMAPEQARGKPVDRRADIWSFGAVLYEMLTGKQLFSGETVSDVLARVLTQPIDFDAVPREVRPLLRRCLERDPKARLRDIGDAWLFVDFSPVPPAAPPQSPARRTPWLVCAVLTFVAATFAWLWWHKETPLPDATRFALEGFNRLGISPDGKWLLGTSNAGLRVLARNAVEWRNLPGTESASFWFWSPDSSAIGFFSGGRLRSISVDGGGFRNLAPAPQPEGGTWRGGVNDGVILISSQGRLKSYEIANGKLSDVQVPIGDGERAILPVFLPRSDRFLYARGTLDGLRGNTADSGIYRASLSGPAASTPPVIRAARQAAFTQDPRTGAWYIT